MSENPISNCELNMKPSIPYKTLIFEISGKCNAKCKWCVTGKANLDKRNVGDFVKLQDFEKAINYMLGNNIITGETYIYLYNWGEPFLHKEIKDIVKFLNDKNLRFGLSTNASVCVGFEGTNTLRNLGSLVISMPGFSQQSYDKIHGFNFEKIKDNIAKIKNNVTECGFKGKGCIAFHIYKFNTHEIELATEFAKSLDMRIACSTAFINDFSRFTKFMSGEMLKDELDEVHKDIITEHYEQYKALIPENYYCPQFDILTIDENLNVLPCCGPQWSIGEIMEMNLEDIKLARKDMDVCKRCKELNLDYILHNPATLVAKD